MENIEDLSPEQILKALLEKAKELASKESSSAEPGDAQTGGQSRTNRWKKCVDQIDKTLKTVPDTKKAAQTDEQTLHLAITMAGAISAGAYTAGVMDYLLEVLDKWSQLKEKPDPRVPVHNVKIEVLSGASAGGMTAAITAVALHLKDRHPIKSFNQAQEEEHLNKKTLSEIKRPDRREQNPFYNSWVNLTDEEMMPVLFQCGDTVNLSEDKKTCVSALNSDFIRTIARRAVRMHEDDFNSGLPEYVSDKLRLFVTLTNLDGFQKSISLGKGGQDFMMTDHRDAVLFRFADYTDPKKEMDGSIKVDFADENGTLLLRQAAMATGAFPVGLAYRTFSRNKRHIVNNILLKEFHGKIELSDDEYRATFIDGGLINNEPFELTEMLLRHIVANDRLTDNPENFNSTILMIDPFPTDRRKIFADTERNNFHPYGLLGAMGKFFSVLRNQVLVKHNVIEKAFNKDNYSCFVIAPTRQEIKDGEEIKYAGSRAIACGTVGGFGGFVSKKFREHDFYLGRINCKSFLQTHFRVPADTRNPVFRDAYSKEAREIFLITEEDTGEEFLPIIPDVNKLGKSDMEVNRLYRNLQYPYYSPSKFKNYKKNLAKRLNFVFDNNVDYSGFGRFMRPIVKYYVKLNLIAARKVLFGKLSEAVKKDLDVWRMNADSRENDEIS